MSKIFAGLGESIGIARILLKLHRAHHFDAIEIPNWEGLGFASTYVGALPVVIRLHTSLAESIEMANRKAKLGERFMIWTEATSSRRARAVITHSNSHRDRMAATYKLGTVTVIPHGIDLPEGTEPIRGGTVFSIGGGSSRKGMRFLLAAIPAVLKQAPEAMFKIVGIGENDALAKGLRKEYGIYEGSVSFLGSVSSSELYQLYDECAVYVSPSTYESFGLTFLEAMAHGRPTVGFATSAMPEVVENGVTGILVEPRDEAALGGAIVKLLKDDTLRGQMGMAGRKIATSRFSMGVITGRIERFFDSVMKRKEFREDEVSDLR